MLSLFDFRRRKRKLQDLEENKRGGAAAQVQPPPSRGPLLNRPVLHETCLARAVANKDPPTLEWCSEPGEGIKIAVGHGSGRYIYVVHKPLLRHYSGYFKGALRDIAPSGGLHDCHELDFPEADPEAFGRFIRWLYSCRACKKPLAYEPDHRCPASAVGDPASWCGRRRLEEDYVLGDWLLSPRYCSFVLSQLVRHVADGDLDLGRVRWILDKTAADSPLQRFTRHWVAWLKLRRLDDKSSVDWPLHPDLAGLDGDGWATTDPRKLRLEHWESPCVPTEAGALCSHLIPEQPAGTTSSCVVGSSDTPVGETGYITGLPQGRLWDKYKERLAVSFGVLVLLYHILSPFAWVAIAAYIIAADDEPLLMPASKCYSLVMGCLAVVGIWPICMRMMRSMYLTVACSLLVVIACVLSFASSVTCLSVADRSENICKMEIGVGVLQFFYAILVATSYDW